MRCGLVFAFIFIFSACSKDHHDIEDSEIIINESYMDARIPKQLWEKIEESDKEEKIVKSKNYKLSSLKVTLQEKNFGVLKKPSTVFSLARGGNVFDMQDLVGVNRGTFYIKFDLSEELNDPGLKVYFISNSKKRRMGDEIIGSGCGRYFDLTKNFNSKFVKTPFPVNTTKERHLSTLGGTFLFVVKKEDQILLSQVTFTDSKMSHLLCEGYSL